MSVDIKALSAEFPRSAVSWRSQSLTKDGKKAMALAYIDARDVMERLDAVCGPENWQDRYEFHGPRTVCYLSIRVGDEWITKADGAGDSDVEAEKGAISDALKRAAVKWGIGRYLYSMPTPWVPCESYEKNGKHYWSRWTGDPWSFVKSAGDPPSAPQSQPEPPPSLEGTDISAALSAIDNASTLEALQAEFAAAWKAHTGPNSRTSIKNRYDARKAALTPAPATLGEHLDNLKALEDARNAIPH